MLVGEGEMDKKKAKDKLAIPKAAIDSINRFAKVPRARIDEHTTTFTKIPRARITPADAFVKGTPRQCVN
jgi:hypothetical protein